MKTKIVYILVSSDDDIYLEQTLISIYSLRLLMPTAIVEIVVDKITDSTISGKRSEILKYVNNKISVDVPKGYNKVQTSRYLKTNLRSFIDGDFLFIDSDTIITDSLDEIDNFEGEMGAVLNLHVPLELHTKKDEIKVRKRISQTDYKIESNIPYFNSGVIFVRDCKTTRTFYEKWHYRWKKGLQNANLCKDQPAMAAANAEMGCIIKEIGGEWNCQVLNNGLPFLSRAKILHYFASYAKNNNDQPYVFLDKEIYCEIKNTGIISDQTVSLINNAKGAFVKPCQVVVGNELPLLSNNLHTVAMRIPKIYNVFEIVAKIILKTHKLLGIL